MENIKKILIFIFIRNPVVSIVSHRFVQIIAPFICGAYYLALDLWGDYWDFISKNKAAHFEVFWILIAFSLVVLCLRGLADWYNKALDEEYNLFMNGIIGLSAQVVDCKLDRFKKAAKGLHKKTSIFQTITKPEDQINFILASSESFLRKSFALSEEQICITILHGKAISNSWYYVFTTKPNWRHTKASDLLNNPSTAKNCLQTGQPCFYPNKIKASSDGNYFNSSRDSRSTGGSIYCYPAFIENGTHEEKYIISIVTYEKSLCGESVDEQRTTGIILREMCRRLELELTLFSIKEWSDNGFPRTTGVQP